MSRIHNIILVDRSGSMAARSSEIITTLNSLVQTAKDDKQKVKYTLCSFDTEFDVIYQKVKIEDVSALAADNPHLQPRGMTALYDAIFKCIALGNPERHTLVQIFSDGMENASEIQLETVQEKIKELEKGNWEFSFIGMDIDAKTAASGVQLRASGKFSKGETYSTISTQSMGIEGRDGAAGAQGPIGRKSTAFYDNAMADKEDKEATETTDE